LVALLILVVVGFIRGLEESLTVSGDPEVVLVHSLGTEGNVETSSVPARTADLLSASLEGIRRRPGPGGAPAVYASGEQYLGTQVGTEGQEALTLGLVRGVTPAALLVRRRVQIVEGAWPGPGEVLVGRLAAAKLGRGVEVLAVGRTVTFE